MPQTRVLIADSHPILGQGLSNVLTGVPEVMVLGVVRTVEEAEALAIELSPDVIILDSDLGVANCAGLAYRIQQFPDRPSIIVLSSSDTGEHLEQSFDGASGFILRGASLDDLIGAIRWAHLGDLFVAPPALVPLPSEMDHSQSVDVRGPLLHRLTPRESQILELLVAGLGHKAIARDLGLSLNTVRTHTRNIQMKLNVHSNVEVVAVALDHGIRPEPQARFADSM